MINVNLSERGGAFTLALTFDARNSNDLGQLAAVLQIAESMADQGTRAADRAAMARVGIELLALREREREAERERREKENPF